LQASFAAVDVCFETPVWNGGKSPWLSGSGKFGTACERIQRAKASADASPFFCDDPAAVVVEELLCVVVVVEPSCAA
jgi:hypothetical protein